MQAMVARLVFELGQRGVASAPAAGVVEALVAEVGRRSNLDVYPRSMITAHNALFFLGRQDNTKWFGCLTPNEALFAHLVGQAIEQPESGDGLKLLLGPTNPANAALLRTFLPHLQPQTLGLRKSAGCGDRLGLATPGHIRALRTVFGDEGQGMAPILAQQSIRENTRTGRTPQEVVDDAMWGVFQEGWRHGYGADADHLKTTADVDLCAAAGYTFFTVDPGEYVDDEANTAPLATLRQKVAALPWEVLRSSPAELEQRLADRRVDLGEFAVTLTSEEVLRAAAKYGNAVAHTVRMAAHLAQVMGDRPYELEMSVDETETVTSLAEHLYIASELQRLGIKVVSLAPRYVGRFEKGADYIGDPAEFARSFAQHAAVARTYGPYKLSLHSGSDKFTIYPIAAQLAGELVHLKTAGTSYLEALRTVAAVAPELFREIAEFAIERYPTDRATYHVSAEAALMPAVRKLPDAALPTVLDDFHAREILHVTFGSVIHHPSLREPFFHTLRTHEEAYSETIERHFVRHFAPFAGVQQ